MGGSQFGTGRVIVVLIARCRQQISLSRSVIKITLENMSAWKAEKAALEPPLEDVSFYTPGAAGRLARNSSKQLSSSSATLLSIQSQMRK
jgi:hypothetical protein